MRKRIIALIFAVCLLSTTPVCAANTWTENQVKANQIATMARTMGLLENNPIIVEAQRIWWEEEQIKQEQVRKEQELNAFLEEHEMDIRDMAGVMHKEARGLDARECSMVGWCILNRYDSLIFGSTIHDVMWARAQFAHSNRTVTDRGLDLVWLATDVMIRWYKEKYWGETDVGRTLPSGYLYYYGNGKHNLFRTKNSGAGSYNFGLPNPYEEMYI